METINVKDVAADMGVSYITVREGIKNGTLPIGFIAQVKSRCRIVIPKKRYEMWKKGLL